MTIRCVVCGVLIHKIGERWEDSAAFSACYGNAKVHAPNPELITKLAQNSPLRKED